MGIHTEYSCSECDYRLAESSDIFWIAEDGSIHADIQSVRSSNEASGALASGGIYKYFCYDCASFIYNFHITRKSDLIAKEEIIRLVEDMDDNVKIIDFDGRFQSCIDCGRGVPLKLEKTFAIDDTGEFLIADSFTDEVESMEFDFAGKYYGYYCSDCSKQINKFVILENNAGLEDSLIREILEDHTNDLTVYINDSYSICPKCGGELQILGESSACPECRKGVLKVEKQTFID